MDNETRITVTESSKKILRSILQSYEEYPHSSLDSFNIWYGICLYLMEKNKIEDSDHILEGLRNLISRKRDISSTADRIETDYSLGIKLDNTSDSVWRTFMQTVIYSSQTPLQSMDISIDPEINPHAIIKTASKFYYTPIFELDIEYASVVKFIEKFRDDTLRGSVLGMPSGVQSKNYFPTPKVVNREDPLENLYAMCYEASNIGQIEKSHIREQDLDRLVSNLENKSKSGVVIKGKAGVGKRHLIHSLQTYLSIVKESHGLSGYHIIPINLPLLMSNPTHSHLLSDIFDCLEEDKKNIFVLEKMVFSNQVDLQDSSSNPLVRMLEFNALNSVSKIVMLADNGVYNTLSTMFGSSLSEYVLQNMDWPNEDDQREILEIHRKFVPVKYDTSIGPKLMNEITTEVEKHSTRETFMNSTIDILDDVCILKQTGSLTNSEIVSNAVSEYFGIDLTKEDNSRYLNIEQVLSEKVLHQDEAIQSIGRTLRIHKSNLRDKTKPVGVLMFLGSTGVGKTYLAEVLSDYLYGTGSLVRINMNEYQDSYSSSRLTGSSPGLVGYDEGSYLVNKLKENPSRVILLDEIEKAHPAILSFFLQILDKGVLMSGRGEEVDITKSIIIMSSNFGSELLSRDTYGVGLRSNLLDVRQDVRDKLVSSDSSFSPEFINRIDSIVVFNKLDDKSLRDIIDKHISKISQLISTDDHKVSLHLSESVYTYLLEADNYNGNMGAREIIRVIENQITHQIAELLLTDQQLSNINVDVEDNEIVLARGES